MQDDGNFAVYAGATPVWATMTNIPAPNGAFRGSNPFAAGQCTYGAEELFHRWTGRYIAVSGNAYQWVGQAQGGHWHMGTTPRIGAIVVFDRGADGVDPVHGHVGWVKEYYPAANKITFDDMNWDNHGSWEEHTITASISCLHYIYANP